LKDANDRDTLFFGEPEKILVEVKAEEGEGMGEGESPAPEPVVEEKKEGEVVEGEEGQQAEAPENLEDTIEIVPVVIPKNFTELDRLAYVVAAIENDTHVVPQGAFKLLPKHEIRRNVAFKGLMKEEQRDLNKYLHFRNVQSMEKKTLIESNESVFRDDILDLITEDKAKGSWCVQLDSSKEVATVRSLLWPGYVAYNELGTGKFGGAYFGDGLKNKDLTFML
jgi:radial spoke head protein 9